MVPGQQFTERERKGARPLRVPSSTSTGVGKRPAWKPTRSKRRNTGIALLACERHAGLTAKGSCSQLVLILPTWSFRSSSLSPLAAKERAVGHCMKQRRNTVHLAASRSSQSVADHCLRVAEQGAKVTTCSIPADHLGAACSNAGPAWPSSSSMQSHAERCWGPQVHH